MSELLRLLSSVFSACRPLCAEAVLEEAEHSEPLRECLERRTGLRLAHLTPAKMATELRALLGREFGGQFLRPRGEGWYEIVDASEEAA